MDPVNPDLQTIKDLVVDDGSFERGYQYYVQGRVSLQVVTDDRVTARVRGSRQYSVSLTQSHETLSASCTCPYGLDGYCKHIVATMMHLYRQSTGTDMVSDMAALPGEQYGGRGSRVGRSRRGRSPGLDYTTPLENLHKMPPADGREYYDYDYDDDDYGGDFHGQYLRSAQDYGDPQYAARPRRTRRRHAHPGTKTAAPNFLQQINEDTPPSRKCRLFLEHLYENAKGKNGHIADKNRVRFDAIEIIAKQYEDRGHPEHAIEVYRHMCEYISENMAVVNDMKQYYTGQILHSMRRVVALMRRLKLGHDEKRDYTLYFFKRYLQEETHHFALVYLDTMYETLKGAEDLDYCRSLFESQLGPRPVVSEKDLRRGMGEMLEAASSLLERIGDGSLGDFLSRHHMQSEDLCIKYIWHLADIDAKGALRLARKAGRTFANPEKFAQMHRFMLERSGDPGQADALRDMFVRTSNWAYYEKLKGAAADWDMQLGAVLDDLGKSGSLHICIDVLLHENRADDAARMALGSCDLGLLDAYSHEFAGTHPDEYHAKYAELVPDLVGSAKTLQDFDDIKRHIEVMRKIPGHGRETKRILAKLESEYPQLAEQMESV